MNFLRGLNKFIQGLLILWIPVIILYWILTLVNISFLKPFEAILGSFMQPFIKISASIYHYEMVYEDGVVNFDPLIFAGMIFALSFVFAGIDKILAFIELMLEKGKVKARELEEKRVNYMLKQKYLEILAKNKIIYVVLKFRKKDSTSSFLYEQQEDSAAKLEIPDLIKQIEKYTTGLNFKKYEIGKDKHMLHMVFYNVTEAIDFGFKVYNHVTELNVDSAKTGTKYNFGMACHCAHNEKNAEEEFQVTSKILNITGENEILSSEIFKNKYEALKSESNIKFETRGIYTIKQDQIEIYHLKVTKNK